MSPDTIWIRARFTVEHSDYRPVKWPPPGPFWCSGTSAEGWPIVVAYVRAEEQVTAFWPEAASVDASGSGPIVFTDRFPRPDWWEGPTQ